MDRGFENLSDSGDRHENAQQMKIKHAGRLCCE